ncbi:MAG: HK97 family phage prohead protease [Paludisphaera borealis]|uniref:HK97 family phage prohead protease n=1 Tax=Paludisphaera borealis TaxID=1387353 RepID=UPI002843B13D|nr:HK97 family phage prohead protease [Paludisphaera borealis]MDR3618230.1 HK97 family phage prohead protease [Paludisphaera borealis]
MATALLYKTYPAAEAKAVEVQLARPRVKRFVITSNEVDRDGDVVLPKGLELDEYARNPVFLWAHQFHMPPVGKCVGLGRNGEESIWADFEYATDEFAERIFKLYDGGFLNAVSIGFKALQVGPPDSSLFMTRPDAAQKCQRVIYRAKLLEVSCVPIPSNPDALQVAVTKGLISPMFAQQLADQITEVVAGAVETHVLATNIVTRIARDVDLRRLADGVADGIVDTLRRRNAR